MILLIAIITLGAWATLSVIGGEMQRQNQALQIAEHNAKTAAAAKAVREAEEALIAKNKR